MRDSINVGHNCLLIEIKDCDSPPGGKYVNKYVKTMI